MEFITSWAKSIIVFILLTTILMNLSAGKKYRQYIRLFSGMVLIIMVIKPIIGFLGNDELLAERFSNYQRIFDNDSSRMTGKKGEELRNRSIMNGYIEYIRESLRAFFEIRGYEAIRLEVGINEDKNYGYIEALECILMKLPADKQKEILGEEIYIEPVDISDLSPDDKGTELSGKQDYAKQAYNEQINILKNELKDFYNVKTDNINITIQEGKDGE